MGKQVKHGCIIGANPLPITAVRLDAERIALRYAPTAGVQWVFASNDAAVFHLFTHAFFKRSSFRPPAQLL